MTAALLFGVAGWSYEDWKGVVYPRGCQDTLRAVAEQVDLIEVNSTFYGLPSAKNCASWVERTEDLGTRFTAKLPRAFTHVRRFDDDLVERVRAGFEPLVGSGRFDGLLAQFSHELEFDAAAVKLLTQIAESFVDIAPVFVELRHRSWNAADALTAARSLGLGVLELDYPGMVGGFSRDVTGARADGAAYFRLHGRNRAWFRRGAGRDEVYDWRYSEREVQQLWARVERIAADATRVIVVANHHFYGKAMAVVEALLAHYRERTGAPRP